MKMKLIHLATGSLLLLLSGCWNFEDGTKQGFTIDGVYNNGVYDHDTGTKDTSCSDVELNRWLILSANHEGNPDTGSSLRMSIVSLCFTKLGKDGDSRFDFVSPKPDGDWQKADGFSFTMTTNLYGLMIRPMLKIRKADGTVVTEISTSGPDTIPLQNNLNTQFVKFNYTRDTIARGEEVLAVIIRVFIPNRINFDGGPEAIVRLDDVIPNDVTIFR